jgi:hypothetical protein
MAKDHSCGQQTGAAHLWRLFVACVAVEENRPKTRRQPETPQDQEKWSVGRAIKVIDKQLRGQRCQGCGSLPISDIGSACATSHDIRLHHSLPKSLFRCGIMF